MPKFSPARAAKKREQFSAFGKAISGKIKGALSDFGASKMVVDNKANPASAYSMMKRKTESKGQPNSFPVGKKLVPYRNDRQKNNQY